MKGCRNHPGRTRRILLSMLCCLGWMVGGGSPIRAEQAKAATTATITVNTTADELNSDGDCSLREAVRAANSDIPVDACPAGSGSDTILLSASTYTLTKVGSDENLAESGDLDITSSLTIIGVSTRDTVINGNHADRIFEVIGSTTLWVRKLTLRNGWVSNSGLYGGGAILNNSTATLDLYLVDLRANSSEKVGGALDNAGTARLNYITLDSNQSASESAVCAGGAIYSVGSLVINNSTISYNTAYNPLIIDYGGGLFSDKNVTLINVTFSHNNADWGGGLFNQASEANLFNVTFIGNSSAIHNTSSLRIKNSIAANSTGGDNCNREGTITSLGYNIDSGDSCSFELENTNPMLGTLADNLGPTFTHALLAGSPAIDHGDPIDCPDTDQRGGFRPADGDLNGSWICDIGAYEYLAPLPNLIYLPILGK
jgi:CSLREA domain-containing protein